MSNLDNTNDLLGGDNEPAFVWQESDNYSYGDLLQDTGNSNGLNSNPVNTSSEAPSTSVPLSPSSFFTSLHVPAEHGDQRSDSAPSIVPPYSGGHPTIAGYNDQSQRSHRNEDHRSYEGSYPGHHANLAFSDHGRHYQTDSQMFAHQSYGEQNWTGNQVSRGDGRQQQMYHNPLANQSYGREHQQTPGNQVNSSYRDQHYAATNPPIDPANIQSGPARRHDFEDARNTPQDQLPHDNHEQQSKSSTQQAEDQVEIPHPASDSEDAEIVPPQTEKAFFEAKYAEIQEARSAANGVRGFPRNDERKLAYVKQIIEAIKNTTEIIDFDPDETRSGNKTRTVPPAVRLIEGDSVTEKILYNAAWEILYAVGAAQAGVDILQQWVPDTLKRQAFLTFAKRFEMTLEVLKTSKAACKGVLTEHALKILVVNPNATLKGKKSNLKTNNRKAAQIEMGRERANAMASQADESVESISNNSSKEIAKPRRKFGAVINDAPTRSPSSSGVRARSIDPQHASMPGSTEMEPSHQQEASRQQSHPTLQGSQSSSDRSNTTSGNDASAPMDASAAIDASATFSASNLNDQPQSTNSRNASTSTKRPSLKRSRAQTLAEDSVGGGNKTNENLQGSQKRAKKDSVATLDSSVHTDANSLGSLLGSP